MHYHITKTVTNNGRLQGYMIVQDGDNKETYISKGVAINLCTSGLMANATCDITGRIRGKGFRIADIPSIELKNSKLTVVGHNDKSQDRAAAWAGMAKRQERMATSERGKMILRAFKEALPKIWANHQITAISTKNTDYAEGHTVEDLYIFCKNEQTEATDAVVLTLFDGDDFICGASDTADGSFFRDFQNTDITADIRNTGATIAKYFYSRL